MVGKPVVILACQVFESLLEQHLPNGLAEKLSYLDYGLHRVPSKLSWTLQDEVNRIAEPSLVVLAYGLCGNGLRGLRSGVHTLLIPRTDDCIGILLGSYKRYLQEFEANPGTYYLTKGWLESGSNPLQEFESYRQQYGEKEAYWLIDQLYQHYERLVFVTHSQQDAEEYRPQALAVAEFCKRWNMRYEEIVGSDIYIKRLLEIAAGDAQADREFVVIPPGGEIKQEMFMR